MKQIFLFITIILFASPLFTQDDYPPISTDRPEQSASSMTVPQKTLQVESGFTYGWNKKEGLSAKDLGFNSTLLRWGVLKRFEIRLGAAFVGYEEKNEITEEKTTLKGMAPLAIGLKWNVLEGDGPVPTLALLTSVAIPALASEDFDDGNVLQNMILAGSWTLSRTFGFGFNFGTIADWKQSDFTTIYTASLSMGIVRWLKAFVELYGFLPAGEYSDHRFDMGFTFPVRNNLQFDISGGMGISKNSPDGFASCGFAWRIPR